MSFVVTRGKGSTMKRTAIAGVCAALALSGIVAPPATAARPVPPHISSVTFEWLGLGTDNSCHSTMTVTIDPALKGRPVYLTKAWLVDGTATNDGYFARVLPGETTFTEEMAYCYPQPDWAYEGVVLSLRYQGGRLVEDPYVLEFPTPYYCR